jgi:uncharacterized protein (TIGR02996 family)
VEEELARWLHQIRLNPSDTTTRLVFADWLDEHPAPVERTCGSETFCLDPHEFVARQIRSQLQEGWGPHEIDSLSAPQLMWGWGLECLRDRSHTNTHWTWRNGLVEKVTVGLHTFCQHHKEIFSTHPVMELELAYFNPQSTSPWDSWWWEMGPSTVTPEDDMWTQLWEEMKRLDRHNWSTTSHTRTLVFASKEDAKLALSEAIVNFARKSVCLPPLYEPTVVGPVR